MAPFPKLYQAELIKVLESIRPEQVEQAIEILAAARDAGNRIFVCGNGGSASSASHFVTDLVKGASFGRNRRFRILALTESLSTITAYSNDVSYECIFAEQMKNFAEPGDVLLAISSSGNSPNVLRAVECGKAMGCRTIVLTGRDGGKLGPMGDLNIQISHSHTGRIEDAHMAVLHMIGYYFMDEEQRRERAGGETA
jgi:D-sedoheptulose 7-phosphate isomerase